MNGHELSQALRSGRRVYGTALTSPAPLMAQAMQRVGLDFVFIDTEHIPIERDSLAWMCQTYRAMNIWPIVRVPAPDPYEACKVLDGGAGGVVFPYVETVEQVQALRGAVKYRPLKGERLDRLLAGSDPADAELAATLKERNADRLCIINIESTVAVERLDELLAVPDVDVLLIGPNDLSINMGIPEQYRHPEFDKTVRLIIEKARAKGVAAGIHFWAGIDQEIEWAKHGVNFLIHHGDLSLFAASLYKDLKKIREGLDDAAGTTGSGKTDAV